MSPRSEAATETRWEGWWSHSGPPEPGTSTPGTLTFDPEVGARLHLVSHEGGDPFADPVREREAFWGLTAFGSLVTVLDARLDRWTGGMFGAGRVEDWKADLIVTGEHVPSREHFEVDDVSFDIRGLREWLTAGWPYDPAFRERLELLEMPSRAGKRRDPRRARRIARANVGRRQRFLRRRYRGEPGFEIHLPDGICLVAGVGQNTSYTDRFREERETTASLWLKAEQPLRFDDALAYGDRLAQLLVLALGEQCRTESITVTRYDPAADFLKPALRPGATTIPRTLKIYHVPWPRLRAGERKYPLEPMLPRRALGDETEKVMQRWWRLLDRLDPAHTMLFGVWNADRIYLENSLLNLTSFAEAYHERLLDEPLLDKDEHAQLVKELTKPLGSYERWIYRRALRYAYRQTQRERMTELVETAAWVVPEVAPDPEGLVSALIATRNHLTHWGDPDEAVVDDGELFEAVTRLGAVLQINILLGLGMDADLLAYGFRRRHVNWDVFRPQ